MKLTLISVLASITTCVALEKELQGKTRAARSEASDKRFSLILSRTADFNDQLQSCLASRTESPGLPVTDWMEAAEKKYGPDSEIVSLIEQTASIESLFEDGILYHPDKEKLSDIRKTQPELRKATAALDSLSEDSTVEEVTEVFSTIRGILSLSIFNFSDDVLRAIRIWMLSMTGILLANVVALPIVYGLQIVFFINPLINLILTFITSLGGFTIAWILWVTSMNILCAARPDQPACPLNWLNNNRGGRSLELNTITTTAFEILETTSDLLRCRFEALASGIIPLLLDLPEIDISGVHSTP